MKNILAIFTLIFCIPTAIFGAATSSPPKNFKKAVVAGDLEALRALNQVDPGDIDHTFNFYGALDKAAEIGALDSLKIILKHPYMHSVNLGIYAKLAGIARRSGHRHVMRWLYKNCIGFNHHDVADHIKEALKNADLESVKFILATQYTDSYAILEALTWSKDEKTVQWIKAYGWALQKLKDDEAKQVPVEILHNNFIDFVVNPTSPEFPVDSIKHLSKILYFRYKRQSTQKLDEELKAVQGKGYTHIARFLAGFIAVRKSPEYSMADAKAKESLETDFARYLYNKWLEEKKGTA